MQGELSYKASDNSPRVLCYYLDTEEEHTIFEAEEVGLTLVAKLISSERNLHSPISILVDNQAFIQSGKRGHRILSYARILRRNGVLIRSR
jgi:hypothetical protein